MPAIDTPANRARIGAALKNKGDFVAVPGVRPRPQDFEFDGSTGADVGFFVADVGRVQIVVSADVRYRGVDPGVARALASGEVDGWRPVGSRQTCDAAALLEFADDLLGLDGRAPRVAADASSADRAVSVQAAPAPRKQERGAGDSDRFGRDLVDAARKGEIDNVLGREREVEALCRIVSKKTKNGAILVGSAGVGKSAVAESFALRIAKGHVPESLKGARLVEVNLSFLTAGATRVNEAEGRFKELLDVARSDRNTILFLDEIHVLCSAGSDISQMVKQDLGRGLIRCIGATTTSEVRALERDEALMRRFQKVPVDEPTLETTVEILRTRKDGIAAHHKIAIDDSLLKPVVDLSVRFVPGRRLPDKAIDLLDEAAAFEAIARGPTSEDIPSSLRIESVFDVLSTWTTIPVAQLRTSQDTEDVLDRLPKVLATRVFGQDRAIDMVTRALQRTFLVRSGSHERRPRASVLFIGPTGVGKTELARALDDAIYGDGGKHRILIDMGDYREEHSIARMIGSPPGYIGHGRGGELTNQLREVPHGVLVFDEIDKCHPRIVGEALLPLIGEGIVHDMGTGDAIDVRNHVIVLTANVRCLAPHGAESGASTHLDSLDESEVRRRVEARFATELLGRLDAIVVFTRLDAETVEKLWGRHVAAAESAFSARIGGVTIAFSEAARALLVGAAIEEAQETGARGVRRVFEQHVTDGCVAVVTGTPPNSGPWLLDVGLTGEGKIIVSRGRPSVPDSERQAS